MTLPLWEYKNPAAAAVIGGFVYRGRKIPRLGGKYVFADFAGGQISILSADGAEAPAGEPIVDANLGVSSFGVDADNELYVLSFGGQIFRLQENPSP